MRISRLLVVAAACGSSKAPPSPSPAPSPPAADVTLAVGAKHACAWRAGKLACWGGNANAPHLEPLDASRGLVAGAGTTCGIDARGGAWCRYDGNTIDLGGAAAIATNGTHACTLAGDGVECRWLPRLDQAAERVTGLDHPVELAPADQPWCALQRAGTVACWGAQVPGTTYDPKHDEHAAIAVAGLDDVVRVAVGGWHACALRKDGTVWCWGANDAGQLGDGTTDDASRPRRVPDLDHVTDISARWTRTCAIASGEVACWGVEDPPSHVDGPRRSSRPARVANTRGAKRVGVGTAFGCAVLADDTIACWGANDAGQLGDPAAPPRRDAAAPIASTLL